MHAGTIAAALLALLALPVLGACAATSPIPEGPPAWREGYAEGCDSGRSIAGDPSRRYARDAERVQTDALYAQGWQAGYDACKTGREDATRRLSP